MLNEGVAHISWSMHIYIHGDLFNGLIALVGDEVGLELKLPEGRDVQQRLDKRAV